MRVTTTEAKNRFGALCVEAKREPVVVEKAGQPDTVILSFDAYQKLVQRQRAESLRGRKKRFNEQYGEWIDAQNRHVEQYGVFGEEFRVW